MVDEWKLVFYETASGRSPVQEYLVGLPGAERDRVARRLESLVLLGTDLGMPHVLRLQGSELWEFRVPGRIQHRIFYVALQGRRFLLLHAFTKKSQATPPREITTAESRLLDFRRRQE